VTLTAEAIEVERRTISAEQRTLLEGFVDELGRLRGSNLSLDAQFLQPLAGGLLPDKGRRLMEGKRRLAISPHRLLHWFPFHAAPWQDAPLVRSFAVRYIPNLMSLMLEPGRARPPFLLALAVSAFPGREATLGTLSSVRETEAIASGYRERSCAVEVRMQPTREELLSLVDDGTLARATRLHLATHGTSASADTPMDSRLELADVAVDGMEISAWPLDACEVVSLSACDAGQLAVRGRGMDELPGDEMFGLPAAFLDAGARSVLAPAWPADDESTSAIMVDFHRRLADGVAPDVALCSGRCRPSDPRAISGSRGRRRVSPRRPADRTPTAPSRRTTRRRGARRPRA
jgi:CHAT domain-containing protein